MPIQKTKKEKRLALSSLPTPATYTFALVVEQDEDGFFVSCPALQGCYTQGDTYEEAMAAIADAVALHVEDRLANGEPIPATKSISVTMLEVPVPKARAIGSTRTHGASEAQLAMVDVVAHRGLVCDVMARGPDASAGQ